MFNCLLKTECGLERVLLAATLGPTVAVLPGISSLPVSIIRQLPATRQNYPNFPLRKSSVSRRKGLTNMRLVSEDSIILPSSMNVVKSLTLAACWRL